ncbi:MAG: hypothetical protein AB4352_12825 [Hormoscilla sp.]
MANCFVGWAPPTKISPDYDMISHDAIGGYCESSQIAGQQMAIAAHWMLN